jgi:hypothetical protein
MLHQENERPRVLRGNNFAQYFRSACCDREQRARRPRRLASALLPLLQRSRRDAEDFGKLRLREAGARASLSNGRDGNAVYVSSLTCFHFSHRRKEFRSDIPAPLAYITSR